MNGDPEQILSQRHASKYKYKHEMIIIFQHLIDNHVYNFWTTPGLKRAHYKSMRHLDAFSEASVTMRCSWCLLRHLTGKQQYLEELLTVSFEEVEVTKMIRPW